HPLALTVPFTANWEEVTLTTAQNILANGHNLAQVVPWPPISPQRKTLFVDGHYPQDPNYPLQQDWFLYTTPAAEPVAVAIHAAGLDSLQLTEMAAVGDIMLDRGPGYLLSQGNLAYPFAYIAPYLQQADITVANFESALGTSGEPAPKHYPFRSPPEAAASLALAGIDIVSLANNHALDYGPDALLEGIDLLHQANVATVGAGANIDAARAPHLITVNNITIAFLAYADVPVERFGFDTETWTATADTPGLAWAHPEDIHTDVRLARPQADLVVVLLHSGFEYVEEPGEEQVIAATAAIDAGADLVIGHHAHIIQGIKFHPTGTVAYGLGNFAFQIEGDPNTAIFHFWLDQNGLRQITITPAIIEPTGQPRLATPAEAAPLRQRLNFLTTILNPTPR
ncbi:MAG TPA: CapA family protein, partial [Anaerolineae bacterium]|nr:CapA family protein [Anaerolineae bacterium]